jgi:hypothetical protein
VERLAAVDRDLVPALDQSGPDLLDRGLEPAVPSWDAPGAEEGDLQPIAGHVTHTTAAYP